MDSVRVAVVACALWALLPGSAAAQMLAGGAIERRPNFSSLVVLTQSGTRAVARVDGGVECGERSYFFSDTVRTGPVDDGPYTASKRGSIKLNKGVVRYRWRLRATITESGASGVLVERARRYGRPCKVLRSRFRLLPASVETGPRAAAPRGPVQLYGFMELTGESARGMTVKVTKDGRVYARWPARFDCDVGRLDGFSNFTPLTRVRKGRFERRERFRISYPDGVVVRYRARFSGRFTAAGAAGTAMVKADVLLNGRRVNRCSGITQRWWAARPD